jgi:glyoxylase-like metal-dependent hydrolase (beta-lactamase superfamily II)
MSTGESLRCQAHVSALLCCSTVIEIDLRPGPSANLVLVRGERPVLVDAGSGTVPSLAATHAFLAAHGVGVDDLTWVVLTHFHADHAGGAGALGVPIAAHAAEASLVNAGDPRACDPWLGFGLVPYRVSRPLRDGEFVEGLQVVHTPGQTPGHVAYWHAETRTAITGDLLPLRDVAWVPFGGPWAPGALDTMIESVRTIAALRPARVIPGHGPVVDDVPAAVEANLARYEQFRADPLKAVWHAVRRALVSHVMTEPRNARALASLPWAAMAASAVSLDPLALVERALGGLAERGAVVLDGAVWVCLLPHELPGPLAA